MAGGCKIDRRCSSQDVTGRPSAKSHRNNVLDIVRAMAANETNPGTQLETFFTVVKRLAIESYYLSVSRQAESRIQRRPGGRQLSGMPGRSAQDNILALNRTRNSALVHYPTSINIQHLPGHPVA